MVDSHWTSSGRGWGLTFETDETPACFHHQHCQMQQPNEERGEGREGNYARRLHTEVSPYLLQEAVQLRVGGWVHGDLKQGPKEVVQELSKAIQLTS